ncbi:MAG: multiheme c-type cytochrome, partial [Nitrososphaerales archaeon]
HLTKILASTPTELCGSCHTQTYNSFLDGTHHSNEVGCIDCHMKRTEEGEEHTPKLDHRFYPTTDLCFDCHNPHTVRSLIDLDKEYSASLFALQEDVADLQYIDYAKNILVVILLAITVILVVLLGISRRRR